VSFASPSEHDLPHTRPPPESGEHLPWGSIAPHRDINQWSPHSTGFPRPAFVPPSAFLTPSTVSSSTDLCGLVSSHCHVRDSLYRGFPRRPADTPRRCAVPSCRWRCSPTTELPRQRQVPPPRLQGLDPSSDPLPPARCLAEPPTRSPPELPLLRASLRAPWRRLHVPSAHGLRPRTLAVTPGPDLQRIVDAQPGALSPEHLPVRAFRPAFPAAEAALPTRPG
jgi:hypothetical protein